MLRKNTTSRQRVGGKSPDPVFHLDAIHAFEVPRVRSHDSRSRGTSRGADPKVGIRDTFAGGFNICFEPAEERSTLWLTSMPTFLDMKWHVVSRSFARCRCGPNGWGSPENATSWNATQTAVWEVEFDSTLRSLTEQAIADLHALVDSSAVPPAVFKRACEECSLYEVCLPRATSAESRAGRLTRQLFEISKSTP